MRGCSWQPRNAAPLRQRIPNRQLAAAALALTCRTEHLHQLVCAGVTRQPPHLHGQAEQPP
jgi:hypothetical protein